jgi:hypothetical protein
MTSGLLESLCKLKITKTTSGIKKHWMNIELQGNISIAN